MFFANFKEVFSHFFSKISFFVSFLLMGLFFYFMSDSEIVKGNYGIFVMYLDIFLSFFVTLFFSIFISVTIFRVKYFGGGLGKNSYGGGIGAFLGILITGCPVCSLNLAFYLGLSSIFTSATFSVFGNEINLFPLGGLEIKILGLLILILSVYFGIKNLKTCKIKKKV